MDLVVTLNTVNLTSAAGFLVARAAGCEVSRRGRFFEATGYRWTVPRAAGFTVGSVVISRRRLPEAVWAHEESHVRQYAVLGPALLPAYLLACGWSWLRTGDWWSRNVFERRAGLVAGGYRENPLRRSGTRSPHGGTAAGAATA
ncbi:MAG: hypothetical protein IPG68_08830 [Micrococcales bacterium]|nr:hypothetical protein [Micrococcales bacterium]